MDNIASYIASKLDDFKNAVMQKAQQLGQAAINNIEFKPGSSTYDATQILRDFYNNTPFVKTAINTLAQGAQGLGRLSAYQNPYINLKPDLQQQYGVGSKYTPQEALSDVGKTLTAFGFIISPAQAVIGGAIGAGLNALSKNKVSPDEAYKQGYELGSALNVISPIVGSLPGIGKIGNVVNQVPLVKNLPQEITGRLGNIIKQSGKFGLEGALYGGLTGRNPVETAKEFALNPINLVAGITRPSSLPASSLAKEVDVNSISWQRQLKDALDSGAISQDEANSLGYNPKLLEKAEKYVKPKITAYPKPKVTAQNIQEAIQEGKISLDEAKKLGYVPPVQE